MKVSKNLLKKLIQEELTAVLAQEGKEEPIFQIFDETDGAPEFSLKKWQNLLSKKDVLQKVVAQLLQNIKEDPFMEHQVGKELYDELLQADVKKAIDIFNKMAAEEQQYINNLRIRRDKEAEEKRQRDADFAARIAKRREELGL